MGKRKRSRYLGRKPQHGHKTRAARRLLGRPWVYESPPTPRLYGDSRRAYPETASERKHRRRREARVRANGGRR